MVDRQSKRSTSTTSISCDLLSSRKSCEEWFIVTIICSSDCDTMISSLWFSYNAIAPRWTRDDIITTCAEPRHILTVSVIEVNTGNQSSKMRFECAGGKRRKGWTFATQLHLNSSFIYFQIKGALVAPFVHFFPLSLFSTCITKFGWLSRQSHCICSSSVAISAYVHWCPQKGNPATLLWLPEWRIPNQKFHS